MAKIASDAVRSLVNYLEQQGLSHQTLAQGININVEELRRSGELIDANVYNLVFEFADRHWRNPHLGFEFGQAFSPDRWGLLGYIAYSSPSLSSALAYQRQYQSLVGDLGCPVMEVVEQNLLLKWIPAFPCNHHVVEEIFTGWVAFARTLTAQTIQPHYVKFAHRCFGEKQKYRDYFGCDVSFNQDYNGICIDIGILDMPLNRYAPDINRLLCQHAEEQIGNLAMTSPYEAITQFIHNQLPHGTPDIQMAAAQLHMSVRTMQRKLAENGFTFTTLIDSIRQELAISFLTQTETKLVYISQMLGFSEQSAFQRAFKRWTGLTPNQYRQNKA